MIACSRAYTADRAVTPDYAELRPTAGFLQCAGSPVHWLLEPFGSQIRFRSPRTSAIPRQGPMQKCARNSFTLPKRQQLLRNDRPGIAGQFEYVHPGVGPIDHVDIAAIIGLDVVGLDRDLAIVLTVDRGAAFVGCFGDRGNKISDFLRMIRIAYVDGPNASIEVAEKHDFLVKNRSHAFIRGVRPKTAAAGAEVAASLRHLEIGNDHWVRFDGDVDEPCHLPRLP